MKFFEKLSLKLFSLIVGTLSVIIILITLNILKMNFFTVILGELLANKISLRITIIVSVILFFIAIRFLLFKTSKEELKDGIILENTNGKLIISRESLENMVSSSAKSIEGLDYLNSKTLIDKEHHLLVYVTVLASAEVVVKDVSKQLQNKIKDTMKNTADLEVSSVSITIKNIVNKKNKNEKETVKNEKETIKGEKIEENIEKDD